MSSGRPLPFSPATHCSHQKHAKESHELPGDGFPPSSLDPHNAQASLKADSILEHSVLRAAPFSRCDQEAL